MTDPVRELYEAYAAENIPEYQSGKKPTWGDVEANVDIETWEAFKFAYAAGVASAGKDADLRDAIAGINKLSVDAYDTAMEREKGK